MPAEVKKEIEFEIAHVLFLDIVGYSKLSVNEQHGRVEELNGIVRLSEQFQKAEAANRILKIPTGDGMALVFYKSPEEPAQCAFEISRALKDNHRLQVRMGIHSGPISGVVDVNERTNVAGAGINLAQRVMDCGDAGHILLSHHVAEDLAEYERWRPYLHDIGTFEVKHGVRVSVTNLYSDEVGNPNLPSKLQAVKKHHAHVRWAEVAIGLLVLGAIVAAFMIVSRRPTTSLTAIPEKSIAVLPFENLSTDKANAYFTDGVQDEILSDLAKIADLKVISRTSVMLYKAGNPRNLREIAQQLGVAQVLEGSVQRAGGKVRVNAQLIDARTDKHLWARTYDRELADVFAIESEVAQAIANELQAKLSASEEASIKEKPTEDLAAYDFYVQAIPLIDGVAYSSTQEKDLAQAVDLLNQAIARDPAFVLAYCWLALAHDSLYFQGVDHTPERLALANAAINSAFHLRPDSGEAHLALARHLYYGYFDYDHARAELAIAQRTLPNNPWVFQLAGVIDRRQGRWSEAVRNLERASEVDPRNVFTIYTVAITYWLLRDYEQASNALTRILAFNPNDIGARLNRTFIDEVAAQRIPHRTQTQLAVAWSARDLFESFELLNRQVTLGSPCADQGKTIKHTRSVQ
jgi:TolB-like protein/cytochrome c-type biogenesis protein CcmH/NrfG